MNSGAELRVDIVGLPGSGKSTLAALLARRLGIAHAVLWPAYDRGQAAHSPGQWRRQRVALALGHPRLTIPGLAGLLRRRNVDTLRLAVTTAYRLRRLETFQSAVFDEGPAQHLSCNIALDPDLDLHRWVEAYRRCAPTVDLTVWVRCDPETARERRIARQDAVNSEWDRLDALYAHSDRFEDAVQALATGRIETFQSGHTRPEDTADRVATVIASLSGGVGS